MESVYVDESATAAIGGQIAQLAARGLSSESAVAAPLTALPPAGADPVSLQAAAAFAAQGAQMLAFDAQAQDFLAQAGVALTRIAATYAAADGASAGTLEAAGTRVAATPTVALGTPINPNTPPTPTTGGGTLLTPIASPTQIDSGYTPTNPSGPVNPLTPIAPPTPIDPGYTPTNPSGPVNPLTPIAPPTPIDPNGPIITPSGPVNPLTPIAPPTTDTTADTDPDPGTLPPDTTADTDPDPGTLPPDPTDGTAPVVPTTGTIPGGTSTTPSETPSVTPTRPADEGRLAAVKASRTSGSATDTTVSTPAETSTGAADSAAGAQTPAAATDATTEAAAAPVELAAAVPADTMAGMRPAALGGTLSGMARPAGAVTPAARAGGVDEVAVGGLASGTPEATPAGAAAGAVGAGAAPMMPVAPASSGSASAGAGPGSPSRSAGLSTSPPNSPPSAAAARAGERDDWTDAVVPVAASVAARDAIESADAARRQGADTLQFARRVTAALHAPDNLEGELAEFFWVTGVTEDGMIVVANTFGLAYIPAPVLLPEKVHMATADSDIPVAERAGWVPDPVQAVRGWAAHHRTKLTALIATEDAASRCEEGAITVAIKPDEIPDSGAMGGRTRLHVVDPEAAQRVITATHLELPGMLPAEATTEPVDEPAAATPQAKTTKRQRSALSRDLMRFWGRVESGHRRSLSQARTASDSEAQRTQIAAWLYWSHLTALVDEIREAPVSG